MPKGSNPTDQRPRFARLVQPLLDSLYRTAFRMAGDRLIAEELVQEACLKAFAQFDRFEDGTNFKAWIFRILTNLCIDHIRKTAGTTFVPIDGMQELPCATALPTDSRTPEALAMGRDVEGAVAQALAAMTPELRVVVMLILIEELSYAEAAESLDLPVGTVRSRLHRARAELQRQLSDLIDHQPQKTKRQGLSRVVMLFA